MSSEREKFLVAAVDLGTTYSGYAISFKHEYDTDPTKVRMNRLWCGANILSWKTPTCVLCDPNGKFDSFGYEAEDKYACLALDNAHHGWYFFRRFKKVLYEKQIQIGIEVEDDKGLKMRAETVFEMAIHYLKIHLLDSLHTMKEMETGVKEEDIHWILTVPAIWTDSAKDFMRDAAMMAGIDERNLTIALEPEAAVMYCQLLPSDHLSSKKRFDDKKYIVIGLGGETVDITVHEKQEDGAINEVFKANCEACGGAEVDKNFNQMIIKIIGARVFKKFCEENMADHLEMCREFENKKRTLHMDTNNRITIKVPDTLKEAYEKESGETIKDAIEQSPYRGKIMFHYDKMRLDAELFRSLFQNCISKITEYLLDLLQKPVGRKLSTLLMVGGFSECQLIQVAVMRAFPNLKVIKPDEAELAVLKGAAIMGHKLGIVCYYNFPWQPPRNKDYSPMTTMFNDVGRALPYEIRRMDEQSQKLYREALSAGTEKVYNIRVMIIGHLGVGKTALTKRLLDEEVIESERESTEGIEIHATRCEIDHVTGEWRGRKEDLLDLNTQRIADVLIRHSEHAISQSKEGSSSPRKEDVKSNKDKVALEVGTVPLASKPHSTTNKESKREIGSSSSDRKKTPLNIQISRAESAESRHKEIKRQETEGIESKKSLSLSTNPKLDGENFEEIEKILKMEPFLTPSGTTVSYVTVLDFAGQFLFYTTHQAFMSWRTIYLLVTDMRLSLTDLVKEDQSATALSGNKTRNVQEYVSYWLNSVHSHVKNPQNVILVATHTDKIPKETITVQKEVYFEAIRRNLSNSILRYHLADEDFAISNIGFDPSIENLKQKIFELAQKQEYWGELIPARWFPLEQVLLEKKSEKVPILDYTEVEELNQSRQVKIEKAEELVLFLQFEHDLGNIVFFCTEKLRRKVVLDPQWLIRGVTTLITSDQVIKKYPDLFVQWYEFKDTGRLTRNLIDSLWSHHAEFHDNKEHLLGALEQLNIIAKPLEKTNESEEDYYWVPCMVHTKAPENIKTLVEGEGVTKTSTLCFESKTKFIHVGVFHRLLATCLSKWMPDKIEEKYLIFVGLCILQLDNCHKLMVYLNDFVIQATVMRHTSKGAKPDLSLCIEVKEYLLSSITEISKYLCPNTEYVLSIMCSRSAPESNEDRHEVDFLRANKGKEIRCSSHRHTHLSSEELLGYWEKGIGKERKERECGYLISARHLDYVAGKLGMDWYSIALQLGLSLAEIQQIQMNQPGNVRCQILTALTMWSHRSEKDDREKVIELVEALNEAQHNDLANELERDLSDIAETSPKGNESVSMKPVKKIKCILL